MPQPNWKTGTAAAAVAALGLTGAGLLNQPSGPPIDDAIHLTDDVDRDFLTGTEAELRRGTTPPPPQGDAGPTDGPVPAPTAPAGGVTAASGGSGAVDAAQVEPPPSPDSPDSVVSSPSPDSPDSVESPDSPDSPASPDSLDT